jgi:hypothetical protein
MKVLLSNSSESNQKIKEIKITLYLLELEIIDKRLGS